MKQNGRRRRGNLMGRQHLKLIILLLAATSLSLFANFIKAQQLSLDCTEFDSSCQWLNANSASASNSTLVWYRSTTKINPDQLQMTCGTNVPPNGSYAIVSTIVVDSVNATQRGTLVSAIVPCQNNNGTLNFNYWTSPFVLLNICCRTEGAMLNRSADCQRGPVSQGPGPASLSIPIMARPFRILIEASNFVYSNGQLTGGFAILDNVKYTGDYCRPVTVAAGNSTASPAPANATASIVPSNTTLAATTNATLAATTAIAVNSTTSNSTG